MQVRGNTPREITAALSGVGSGGAGSFKSIAVDNVGSTEESVVEGEIYQTTVHGETFFVYYNGETVLRAEPKFSTRYATSIDFTGESDENIAAGIVTNDAAITGFQTLPYLNGALLLWRGQMFDDSINISEDPTDYQWIERTKGDAGVGNRTIYLASAEQPTTPSGGSIDSSGELTVPAGGWSEVNPGTTGLPEEFEVYQSVAYDNPSLTPRLGGWGAPFIAEGIKGETGETGPEGPDRIYSETFITNTGVGSGNTFRNNTGTDKILKTNVFQGTTLFSDELHNSFTYTWTKNGTTVLELTGTNGGRTFTVSASDVTDGGAEEYACLVAGDTTLGE